MASRWSRRTALFTGMASLLVVALGVAFAWRDIAVLWHERKLEREPGILVSMLLEPKGSPAREAALRFLRKPKARPAILKAYLTQVCETDADARRCVEGILGSRYDQWFEVGVHEGKLTYRGYTVIPNWSIRGGGSGSEVEVRMGEALEAMQEGLANLRTEVQTLPDYPGVEFTLVSLKKSDESARLMGMGLRNFPGNHVLLGFHRGAETPELPDVQVVPEIDLTPDAATDPGSSR